MDDRDWRPSTRVPDPAVRELDPRFAHYRLAHAKWNAWVGNAVG